MVGSVRGPVELPGKIAIEKDFFALHALMIHHVVEPRTPSSGESSEESEKRLVLCRADGGVRHCLVAV